MSGSDKIEVPLDVKPRAVQKLFDRLNKKMVETYEGNKEFLVGFIKNKWKDAEKNLVQGYEELKIANDDWRKLVDIQLAAFEKKYGGLYTVLTRTFLVNQEKRIHASDMFGQATLELFLEEIYSMKSRSSTEVVGSFEEWREGLAKRHGEIMQRVNDEVNALKQKESLADGANQESNGKAAGVDSGASGDGQRDDRSSVRAEGQDNGGSVKSSAPI